MSDRAGSEASGCLGILMIVLGGLLTLFGVVVITDAKGGLAEIAPVVILGLVIAGVGVVLIYGGDKASKG